MPKAINMLYLMVVEKKITQEEAFRRLEKIRYNLLNYKRDKESLISMFKILEEI
ncbi:hypothetical protein LCGC14_2725620 [marine sediment metagenome]|uniref:Uncharacterized protein n=1 Tax=marine sediment metagenome TaxID=412755 RepID=A0A0F8Z8V4_9ZZZZ